MKNKKYPLLLCTALLPFMAHSAEDLDTQKGKMLQPRPATTQSSIAGFDIRLATLVVSFLDNCSMCSFSEINKKTSNHLIDDGIMDRRKVKKNPSYFIRAILEGNYSVIPQFYQQSPEFLPLLREVGKQDSDNMKKRFTAACALASSVGYTLLKSSALPAVTTPAQPPTILYLTSDEYDSTLSFESGFSKPFTLFCQQNPGTHLILHSCNLLGWQTFFPSSLKNLTLVFDDTVKHVNDNVMPYNMGYGGGIEILTLCSPHITSIGKNFRNYKLPLYPDGTPVNMPQSPLEIVDLSGLTNLQTVDLNGFLENNPQLQCVILPKAAPNVLVSQLCTYFSGKNVTVKLSSQ